MSTLVPSVSLVEFPLLEPVMSCDNEASACWSDAWIVVTCPRSDADAGESGALLI